MTTEASPVRELIETLEYRGSTIYLYHQPEQDIDYEKDVYEWDKPYEPGQPYGSRNLVKVGVEPAVRHFDNRYYASFKELPAHSWSHFQGDTAAKALKSAKHNVDVSLADEALRPVLVRLIGYDKTGEITDKFPHPTPNTVQEGDVAWLYSRGGWRRGVVEKVGRTNVTIAYVTEGGVSDAQKHNFDPSVTRKSAKFEHVALEVDGSGTVLSVSR